ncbi:hypothetical protein HA402_008288 [Bradysia odoriphaga]|nr:hypothetical protein HA402_008288 [Bradysia odoriphaga]
MDKQAFYAHGIPSSGGYKLESVQPVGDNVSIGKTGAPQYMDMFVASGLNNEALRLESDGNYAGAEKKHLEALDIKMNSPYGNPIGRALTQNGLGELYMKMGKLDQAQEMLEAAYKARSRNNDFDKSCTADNLGRLFEMKGNIKKAIEWRTANGPNQMICSNYDCPKSGVQSFSKLDQLKKCGKCKCAYYCDTKCQKNDWRRHKSFCKTEPEASK